MKKKLLAVLLCLCMTLSAAVMTFSASALSNEVTDSTWSEIELQGLVVQQGDWLYSDMNQDYEGELWNDLVEELDSYETMCQLNMRGFAMSPDRKYAYFGTLNGGIVRGCAMFDFETGTFTDLYYHYETENTSDGGGGTKFSFAKGIAADDRGYVYVGFALSYNYNLVNLGIAQVNPEEKKLNEVSLTAIYEFGNPGDPGGVHVGVNGVEVQKIGDRYYCYAMINYDVDRLVCYDVTDPANPVLNKNFGIGGILDFNDDECPVKSADVALDDGNYLDVDEDGTIWLCVKTKTGDTGIMKIAPDGSALLNYISYKTAYAVTHEGHYIVVVDKGGSFVDVLDDASLEKVATVKYGEDYGVFFSRVQIIDDILFVADTDNNDGSSFNVILAAGLTAEAQVKLSEMAAQLTAKPGEDETQPDGDGTTEPGNDTQPDEETTAPAEETTAPAEDTKAPGAEETTAPAEEATTSADKTAEETGCASVMGIGAVFAMILAAAGYMIGKRR